MNDETIKRVADRIHALRETRAEIIIHTGALDYYINQREIRIVGDLCEMTLNLSERDLYKVTVAEVEGFLDILMIDPFQGIRIVTSDIVEILYKIRHETGVAIDLLYPKE